MRKSSERVMWVWVVVKVVRSHVKQMVGVNNELYHRALASDLSSAIKWLAKARVRPTLGV